MFTLPILSGQAKSRATAFSCSRVASLGILDWRQAAQVEGIALARNIFDRWAPDHPDKAAAARLITGKIYTSLEAALEDEGNVDQLVAMVAAYL